MAADELDTLFSTLPAAFVQARNALAKSLKSAGRRDEAAKVAALSRPSPAVWAVNQIARRAPEMVARLGALTAQLQRAGAGSYGELVNEHRDLLKALREKGGELLEEAGLRASPEALAAVVQSLRAGMADEATRSLIERGRLDHDVASEALASGFVAPPGSDLPVAKPVAAPPAAKRQPERETAARDHAEAAAARVRAAAHTEAQKRIARLRAALGAAERRQSAAERAHAEAQAALAEAEQGLEAAREAAAQAAGELARAEAALAALAP